MRVFAARAPASGRGWDRVTLSLDSTLLTDKTKVNSNNVTAQKGFT